MYGAKTCNTDISSLMAAEMCILRSIERKTESGRIKKK
jgi:hypothetical protein